jgi:hypothetical protein
VKTAIIPFVSIAFSTLLASSAVFSQEHGGCARGDIRTIHLPRHSPRARASRQQKLAPSTTKGEHTRVRVSLHLPTDLSRADLPMLQLLPHDDNPHELQVSTPCAPLSDVDRM